MTNFMDERGLPQVPPDDQLRHKAQTTSRGHRQLLWLVVMLIVLGLMLGGIIWQLFT